MDTNTTLSRLYLRWQLYHVEYLFERKARGPPAPGYLSTLARFRDEAKAAYVAYRDQVQPTLFN